MGWNTSGSVQDAAGLNEWFHAMEERDLVFQFAPYATPNRFFESSSGNPLWDPNGGYVGFKNGTPIQGISGSGWAGEPKTNGSIGASNIFEWAALNVTLCWDPTVSPNGVPPLPDAFHTNTNTGLIEIWPTTYSFRDTELAPGQNTVRRLAGLPDPVDGFGDGEISFVRRWGPRTIQTLEDTTDQWLNAAQPGQVAFYGGQKARCVASGRWVVDHCAGPVDRLDSTQNPPNWYGGNFIVAGEYIFNQSWWTDRQKLAQQWTGGCLQAFGAGSGTLVCSGGSVAGANPNNLAGWNNGNIVEWSAFARDDGNQTTFAGAVASARTAFQNSLRGPVISRGAEEATASSSYQNPNYHAAFAVDLVEWDFMTGTPTNLDAYVWVYGGFNPGPNPFVFNGEGLVSAANQWTLREQTTFGGTGAVHQYRFFNYPADLASIPQDPPAPSSNYPFSGGSGFGPGGALNSGTWGAVISFDGRRTFQYT